MIAFAAGFASGCVFAILMLFVGLVRVFGGDPVTRP